MSRSKKRKHSKKYRRRILLSVIAAAAAGLLIFWEMFYIRHVEVVGNTRYTQEEIQEIVMKGFLDKNSVYLSVFRNHIKAEGELFLDSVDVEYLGRDTVRLIVTEKNPVGYVSLEGTDYYFDKDGVVLGEVSESSALEPGGTGLAGNTPEASSGEEEQAEENGTEPSLEDLPLVTGLGCASAAVGEKLSVKDDSVFGTVLALNRMFKKYDIQPDSLEFSEDLTVTLHYGNVRVDLGKDTDLEEKMIRAAAILPKLEGKSGVLHMEDYTEDTQNLVFSQDGEQEDSLEES